jgi:hypothetical protein
MSLKVLTFIEKAHKVHGDKFDYSKVEYVNAHTKVCIICPIHGEFWQTPNDHLRGNGCRKCGIEEKAKKRRTTIDEFIRKAKEKHGDKYDYSKVEYINARTKVCIICPEHGEFWQLPDAHLKGGGCNSCGCLSASAKMRKTTEDFIEKARKVHGDKYDYSKVEYVNSKTPVCIICPKHGEFWQLPSVHNTGKGCQKCGEIKRELAKHDNLESFIKKAQKIHGSKYDYSKVDYKSSKIKVCIVCPKHGEFWIAPSNHLQGQGCSKCKNSILEQKTECFLKEKGINFLHPGHFKWLGRQHLDFYLSDYNVAIECQGEQHYRSVDRWGGNEGFKKRKKLDKNKFRLCNEHNIKIYYIGYYENVKEKLTKILNDLG